MNEFDLLDLCNLPSYLVDSQEDSSKWKKIQTHIGIYLKNHLANQFFCDCTNKYYLIQHKDGGLNFLFAEVE